MQGRRGAQGVGMVRVQAWLDTVGLPPLTPRHRTLYSVPFNPSCLPPQPIMAAPPTLCPPPFTHRSRTPTRYRPP